MGKTNILQTDFLAGEISPRMEMQDNLEGRKHGVETMENFFIHLQGSVETSRGTKWVADVAGASGRMFGFPISFDLNFMVVISNGTLSVFDSDGLVDSFVCSWTTLEEVASVQAHMLPDKNAMIISSSGYAPAKLLWSGTIFSFAPLPLTSAPAEWTAGNYPPAMGFYGGRLWLGGIESDPAVFWGSKLGGKVVDYGDFTLGSLDEDAIEARLSRQGAISWIAGGPGLLIGTSNAEHVISSEEGVITPGDINSKIQSTNGSYPTQSLEVGNEIMYISPDGRKIRSIGYEWLKDSWRSRDLTHASEHITKGGKALTNLNYATNPDSLIIGTTQDGALVFATYEPYSQTVGFSRRSTQGDIISTGVAPSGGYDELWMLVDRGEGVLHVEKEVHPGNVKLDNYTVFTSATPITGGTAPQLGGKACQVLVDGAVHPSVIPSAAGVFETEYSGLEIKIGLKMLSILKTLPVADAITNVGTTRSMKKRLAQIWVKVIESWRPKINGHRPNNRRVSTPMGEVEEARTETVEVANEGWDMDAQITIEQDLPLPTEVSGWFGRILQEET